MARTRKQNLPPTTPPIDDPVTDQLAGEATTMAEVEAIFRQMKKQVMERILRGELSHHLGYKPGEEKPAGQSNHRNGATPKTVLTEDGPVSLAIPRDRAGSFEPLLIPKHARRLPRFDDNVVSRYARGMTVREIQRHLEDLLCKYIQIPARGEQANSCTHGRRTVIAPLVGASCRGFLYPLR